MFNRPVGPRKIGGLGGIYKPPKSVINKPVLPVAPGDTNNFLQRSKGTIHQVSTTIQQPIHKYGNLLAKSIV